MKKNINFLTLAALFLIAMAGLTGCVQEPTLLVSTNDLWFDMDAGSKTLDITANCKWTVQKTDDADWYSIDQMSGKNDAIVTITVQAMGDADYRGSSFTIISPNGHVRRTIFVTQNKVEVYKIVNKIYGVTNVEHWNTDYFGQMVEDSYKQYVFDPYDTTRGYLMYFFEDGQGVQRDHHKNTVVYYAFTYNYNPIEQILHIEFETVTDAPESYDPQVLTASDSLYRFMHEYKPNWWERADMRKVGEVDPNAKTFLKHAATKRKESGPIFQF